MEYANEYGMTILAVSIIAGIVLSPVYNWYMDKYHENGVQKFFDEMSKPAKPVNKSKGLF